MLQLKSGVTIVYYYIILYNYYDSKVWSCYSVFSRLGSLNIWHTSQHKIHGGSEKEGTLPFLDKLVYRIQNRIFGHKMQKKLSCMDSHLPARSYHHPTQKSTFTKRPYNVSDIENLQLKFVI